MNLLKRLGHLKGISDLKGLGSFFGDLFPQTEPAAAVAEAQSRDNGERMFVRRRQRLSEGFICSDQIIAPRACTLRDMTALGGRVDLWDEIRPAQLRSGVKLYISNDRTEVECEVKWIRDKSLGLEFKAKPQPAPAGRYR